MKITHIEHDYECSVSLDDWINKYVKTGKYKNYKITSYNKVCELYKIDEITSEKVFVQLMQSYKAKKLCLEDPVKYSNQGAHKNSNLYNEYLIPYKQKVNTKKSHSELSFLKRIKDKIQQIITANKNPNRKPFTKYELWSLILMVLTIIVTILLSVLIN